MSFLKKLGNKLEDFYNSAIDSSFGQTENQSLSSVKDGVKIPFGALGDFAKKIDKSAIRSYTDDGFLRTDLFNSKSRQLEILMQEPNATVLIKKKMFSSLSNNFRPDYMSEDEKLFYKASKLLFKNKCGEISALEQLSKINRVLELDSSYTEQFLPAILSAVDSLTGVGAEFPGLSTNNVSGLEYILGITNKIKSILSFSNQSKITTWLTDLNDEGTGVIELTNVSSFNTTGTLETGGGSASLTISDPYNKMLVTEYDIEKAISDATDSFYNKSFFKFSLRQTEDLLASYLLRFNELRNSRNASPISFKINANTVLSKRVVAIVDRIGVEIQFDFQQSVNPTTDVKDEYLVGGILGNDGLDPVGKSTVNIDFIANTKQSELYLFKEIISTIFTKLALTSGSQNSYQLRNAKTNYARKKMRSMFLGQNIIQSMDEVRIFVSSKSQYDSKVLAGLKSQFSGLNIAQKFASSVYDLKNQFSSIFNPDSNLDLQSEKAVYVGSSFPDRLWVYLRNLFVSNTDGICIFAGLVSSTGTSYSPNSGYSVRVNCKDNTGYLEMGKVNFNPGADNFNGAIFDQLTPFKTKFDQITTNFNNEIPELLDENKIILGTASQLLKFKAGPGIGQYVTESNFISDITINPTTGQKERFIYAPDGMVYNWKQGIGVYVAFGNSLDINDPNKVGIQSIFKNPFAGQDVMNVISLLVTGRPYNFINYWKAVTNLDGFQSDPLANKNGANSYFANLQNELTKNNVLWGNFIPFKTLTINEEAYAKVLSAEITINKQVAELNDKLQEYQVLDTKNYLLSGRKVLGNPNIGGNPSELSGPVVERMNQLKKDIEKLQQEITVSDNSNFGLSIIGNDVIFDSDDFINDESKEKSLSNEAGRRNIRRRVNELTKRLAWKVRSNTDNNLFIVDDSYDKDYDFAAFESNFNDLSLYNNEFTSVLEKIKLVTGLLNLEFYADTQGNLRVRPPQFNKIPSSVFYRLINLKKEYNMQLYPQFLDSLFRSQLDGLRQKIEVIEDEIRLFFAFIDINTDFDIKLYFIKLDSTSEVGSIPFDFITNEQGIISSYDTLVKTNDPDIFEQDETLQIISSQALSNRSYYTPKVRSEFILSTFTPEERSKYDNASSIIGSERVDVLKQRLKTKTGKPVNIDDLYFNIDAAGNNLKQIDRVQITNFIANKLSERQRAVKTFYNSLKNSIELRTIDNDDVSNSLLTPRVSFGNAPEILEHLIEDESYDDLGPGSGARFILKNSAIKSLEFSEQEPEFTAVQANGSFNQFESINGGSDLTTAIESNLGLSSAFAIDYDLWRKYGMKSTSPVNVPFLTDPRSQLSPYATTLLLRARKNILKANVTIAGNEYQQPGDVVYLEENQLLYYVKSVSHNFTYGSSFTTNLTLEYGHSPGDYIPNVFDTVGKVIYNNKDSIDFINYRQDNYLGETHIGTIILDENSPFSVNINKDNNQFISKYSKHNSKTIQDILNTIAYQMNINNVKNNPIEAKIELRIYKDESYTPPDNLVKLREDVKQLLTGQKETFNQSDTGKLKITISKEYIDDNFVDLSNEDDPRSPSQQAINIARDIYSKGDMKSDLEIDEAFNSVSGGSNLPSRSADGLKRTLFKYVIDCFVKFETKEIL